MKYNVITRYLLSMGIVSIFSFTSLFAQNIDSLLAIQEVDTMLYSGPKDNRINWVIQNRGNSFSDKDDFTSLYRNDLLLSFELGHMAEQPPYAQYRNFFNLFTYWWPDAPDDGNGWTFGTIQAMRDKVFLPWATEDYGWATWFSSTKHGGGGGAGLVRENRVGDGKMYGMGWETFLHEFGHTMPGLLDEYSASGSWSNGQCWETGNSSGELDVENIPWRFWIEEGTPIPTPYTDEYLDKFGAFEGAMTNYFGCHRPTARGCIMGAGGFGEDYGQVLCDVCRQRIICYLYQYVDVIENPQPAPGLMEVTGEETVSFSVDVIKPEPNTQKSRWILNGKVIAQDVEQIELTFGACASNKLIFEVHDTNTMVRFDPKFEEIYPKPLQRKIWTINQTDVDTYPLVATAQVVNADCTGNASGQIEFQISEGLSPYQVFYQTVPVPNPVEDLSSGMYSYDIVDALGCGITQFVEVDAQLLLDPQICTAYENGNWIISVMDENYPENELTYQWSDFSSTTSSITVVDDGWYTVWITTALGCVAQRSVLLDFSVNELTADHSSFPTELNTPTGKIFLNIQGGRSPYSIEWEEKLNHDLTDTTTANILSSGTTWDHLPQYAFDNSLSTKWLHAVATDAYIGYSFLSPVVVNYYAITSADDVPERDPRNWMFQGSSNGVDWLTLDEQTDHTFTSRYQRKGFLFDNDVAYRFYRLFVNENYGDIATQIQELEIFGVRDQDAYVSASPARDQTNRSALGAGLYRYTIKDGNATAYRDSVFIDYAKTFVAEDLVVIQDGSCQVRIESPDSDYDYYWFPDQQASQILNIGDSFQPQESGNFYVAAVELSTESMSSNVQGFAVTVAEMPSVEVVNDTLLSIINPNPALKYKWYEQDQCGDPLHVGDSFTPSIAGTYFVSAEVIRDIIDPMDPALLSGMIIRMDAADLNGDGLIDVPPPPTSSLYGWNFTNGNAWADNNWFAFRSNHQNGLGVADFATIWLQRINNAETDYQTILMAYEENPITFPKRAPFEGLTDNIPKHTDETQLYSDDAPASTLNGTTYLNGEIVDPLATANPMEFCILGTVMTEPSDREVYYTDTHWEGKIGELILYDRPLTEAEMKGVSEFLRKKWISVADLESPRRELLWDGIILSVEPDYFSVSNINVYPNPTKGHFTLSGIEEDWMVHLLDASGKFIQEINYNSNAHSITSLPDGIYFIKIASKDHESIVVMPIIKH